MLKIAAVRAKLGKSVTAKLKNNKDDQERVIEFGLSEISLTQQQLSDLVACHKHERKFSIVAFVSTDAISELRHFKKLELSLEVQNAVLFLERVGTAGDKLQLPNCTLKKISLGFKSTDRCEMACKVWTGLDEHALFTLGAWSSQDLFVSVDAPAHGEEKPSSPTGELALASK